MQAKQYINMNASILNIVGYTKCHSRDMRDICFNNLQWSLYIFGH
jgi:hypothetical protein